MLCCKLTPVDNQHPPVRWRAELYIDGGLEPRRQSWIESHERSAWIMLMVLTVPIVLGVWVMV